MRQLFFLFLGLHLLGAVIAYGPSLVVPLLARRQAGQTSTQLHGLVELAAERLSYRPP